MPKKLPGRTFQHILETNSEKALANSLPSEWVLEPRAHDYGIDLDIEVFEDGQATGLRIPVQLKGQQDSGQPARIRLKRTSIEYWKESNTPVIVVIWDEKTNKLWWEWQYLLDSHRAKASAVKVTVVVGRIWDELTPAQIIQEARAHKAITRGAYTSPLPLQITSEANVRGNAGLTRLIVARTRSALLTRPEIVLSNSETGGELLVHIEERQISVRLRGAAGVVLHFDQAFPKGASAVDVANHIVADLLSAVVTLASAIGMRSLADYLLEIVAQDTQLLLSEKGLARSLSLLAQANNVRGFANLFARAIQQSDEDLQAIAWYSLSFFSDVLNRDNRIALVESVQRLLIEDDHLSRALYSLAQVIKHDDHEFALRLYSQAAEADAAYRKRPYWWSDQGAVYFNSENYSGAIEYYAKAVELGEDSTRYLLADALLWAGHLDEALDEFSTAFSLGLEATSEWKLKQVSFTVLRTLLTVDFPEEPIDPEMVPDTNLGLDIDLGSNPRGALIGLLRDDYRQADYLAALALLLFENASIQTYVMITFAFIARNDVTAWTMAMEAAVSTHPELLADLADCAMRFCGDAILEYQAIEGEPSAVVHDTLLAVKRPTKPFTIREVQTGKGAFNATRIT